MARNEQLIRQHKTLQILERYRYGRTMSELRDEIKDELGLASLHPRSVRRDLEALQRTGIDIRQEDVERGRVWKLGPLYRGSHKISVSATELIALSLGRDLLFPLAGTPFWMGIESFWNTIREELPDSVWRHYEKYRRVLHVLGTPAKSYREHHGIIKTLNRAILEHRVVEAEYRSLKGGPATRRIEPYAIVVYQSSLYIIAAAAEVAGEERMRHFKLDRFLKAELLDEWFQPDGEFNAAQYVGDSLGVFGGGRPRNFKIKISAYAAPWVIEDPWHPGQQVEQDDDGGIILSVQAAHDLEIIPRVLSLGTEAEILAPASCRRTIAEMVRTMAGRYAE